MTLFRYLLRAYAARILGALLGAWVLLLVADLTDLGSALARRPEGLRLVLELYAKKTPWLLLQALPLAALLGVTLTVAAWARSRELVALRAAGAGPLRLALPALVLLAALSGGAAIAAAGPVPHLMKAVVHIQTRKLQRFTYAWTLAHKPRHWLVAPDGALLHVERVLDSGRRLEGLARLDFDGGHLRRLATAPRLEWDGARWTGPEGSVWTFTDLERVRFEHGALALALDPRYFGGIPGLPEELTTAELDAAVALYAQQGRDTVALRVERASRPAMAFLPLAAGLLALGLCLGVRSPASPLEAAMGAVLTALVVWTALALARAAGLAGMVAPGVSAWTADLLAGVAGLALLLVGRGR